VSSLRIAGSFAPWLLGCFLALFSWSAEAQSLSVQITGLGDLSAAASSRLAPIVMQGQACIRAAEDQPLYQVRITSGTGADLVLRNTSGSSELPFTVVWNGTRFDRPGQTGVFAASGSSCGTDAHLAAYEVHVDRHDLLSAIAGDYRGSLVIDVSAP
jgi:hypothetical protein